MRFGGGFVAKTGLPRFPVAFGVASPVEEVLGAAFRVVRAAGRFPLAEVSRPRPRLRASVSP